MRSREAARLLRAMAALASIQGCRKGYFAALRPDGFRVPTVDVGGDSHCNGISPGCFSTTQ
jgi:hypothetical protein